MSTLLGSLRKKVPLTQVLYMLLIFLSMRAVLLGVELVVRGTSVAVLQVIILFGILLGWLLARSRIKLRLAAPIALLCGIVLTVLRVSGMGNVLWDLLGAGLGYLWRYALERSANPDQLIFLTSVLQARFLESLNSISLWVNDLATGFAVYNQISTLLSWGLILWVFSCWFAWTTFRMDQPIWGILPPGVLLSIMMTYTLERRYTLVILLGAGLILIGMVNFDAKQRSWEQNGVKGAEIIRERVYLAILGFSLYTMAFAGLMPSIRISPIADRFEKLVYGTEDSEGGEGAAASIEVGGLNSELYSIERFAGLPRQKLIGSGPELAKRVVMIVSYPTTSFVDSELPNAARYWRSYTYDRYTGSGWQSSPTVEVSYQPGQEISQVVSDSEEIITQEFRLSNTVRGTLFSAGPPVTIDHEVLVSWRSDDGDGAAGVGAVDGGEDIFAVTFDALVYQVRSLVPLATDDQLREDFSVYPTWVSDRYLDLPESLPERVLDLALEITKDQPSRYDQAKAIESFLRTYPYTLDISAPPQDRDIADYFLFDLQTGYCDYYATSMVVLARASGLPARLVVGYVGGLYDPDNDYYLVSEADAHTWVEVYFNGYGWIPFEPTAARSLISEEAQALPLPPELANLPQSIETQTERHFPYWQLVPALLLAAGLGWVVYSQADLARLRGMETASLALVLYQRLYRYGRWMDLGHRKSDTPFEFKEKLIAFLNESAAAPRRMKRLAGFQGEIDQLTDHAVTAFFSSQELSRNLNTELLQTWLSLRSKLRQVVWRSWLRTLVSWLFFWEKDRNGYN
ncbi:MAG: transglutaminase domain-containing protein [Anaerolineales bacterium]